ncbi:ABC transporter G family member 20-like [Daphnia pulicaria]|uniref:ABC transporter G family member 20-like n=1 Tax=Daphnia pulicaria TaxID=35523 RepID=UPI001EEC6AAB|nr:ABC transporter G family member 20-like [Daphnia pulicaria]
MKKSVELSSEVFLTSHRLDHSDETNNNNGGVADGVVVRNAIKSYGVGSNRYVILNGLNMTVKKGTIYGLLGASGCGKTTLLSCLVGRRTLNNGEVLVLGHEPGSPNSGIPGPQVGYMPQELALYDYFTIKETLEYFGRIYKLKSAFVKSQLKFLSNLLDLPPCDRYVKTLSGGQQRRVSFAVALFHDPDLLILDEPTVGVDPLLSNSIWNHLVRLSVDHGKTVIVTTHYIEEARQSHTIGMMRSGRLLVEESPANLLRDYGLSSLEDVFLKLCLKDDGNVPAGQSTESNLVALKDTDQISAQQPPNGHVNMSVPQVRIPSSSKRPSFKMTMPSPHRVGALIRKNYLLSFRNIGIFLFTYLLPALQAALFNVTLGHEPMGLKMAVVNEEIDSSLGRVCNYTTDCAYSMLSCRYLRYINNNIIQVPYENVSAAIEAGRHGKVWGVIHFGKNFTQEFEMRQSNGDSAELDNIIRSRISINMDSSNQQIDVFIEKWLVEAFENFIQDFLKVCGNVPEAGYLPIVFLDPVYGQKNTPFTEFMAPGLIISIVYNMAVALTAGVFITERKQGLIDRSLVAGVQMPEILLSYLINQFTIIIGQTALVYLFMLMVFKIPCQGDLALAILITLLQGLVGISFGLLISTGCDNEMGALSLSQASFLPLLVISGICWPIEGMPFYLRKIAYAMPLTYAIESVRCIFARGWGVEQPNVYAGILVSCGWILTFLVLCLVVARVRNSSS